MRVIKHASERIPLGFETQGRCQQKSKIGVSVASQKGLMSSNYLKKNLQRVWITVPHYSLKVGFFCLY